MVGGTLLPLLLERVFTLCTQLASNLVTTKQYSNFYVCMLCDSMQIGIEQLHGCA